MGDNKIKKLTVNEENIEDLSAEEAYERQYYEDSIILKIKDGLVDDIATCFSIQDTMNYLMLAPLDFISRTDGIENEKEYKEMLWKEVRNFYITAREMLDKRYRL
jgi:hypothetical protein